MLAQIPVAFVGLFINFFSLEEEKRSRETEAERSEEKGKETI